MMHAFDVLADPGHGQPGAAGADQGPVDLEPGQVPERGQAGCDFVHSHGGSMGAACNDATVIPEIPSHCFSFSWYVRLSFRM